MKEPNRSSPPPPPSPPIVGGLTAPAKGIPGVTHKHLFRVQCERSKNQLASMSGRPLPEGTRIHVTFSDGSVTPGPSTQLRHCRVLSGGDSILVRNDGVVVFETRFTIGSPELGKADSAVPPEERFKHGQPLPADAFIFNMLLAGVAKLGPDDPLRGRVVTGTEAQADGQTWRGTGIQKVALPAIIEASTEPIPRPAQHLLIQLARNFSNIGGEDLKNQCLAVGHVTFDKGAVNAVDLMVYSLAMP